MKRVNLKRTEADQRRWDRWGLRIRCAYNPHEPNLLRCYLLMAQRLARCGGLNERHVWQHTLLVLLRTASDTALPIFWRSVCMEHTALPLARLTTCLREQEPGAVPVLHARVENAWSTLNATPAPLNTDKACANRDGPLQNPSTPPFISS